MHLYGQEGVQNLLLFIYLKVYQKFQVGVRPLRENGQVSPIKQI